MATFLRMRSMRMAFLRGISLPSVNAEQGSRCLLGGPFLRTIAEGGRWRCRDGAPFSSWTGGDGPWMYQTHQRSRLARWGDWASLGLVVLMGGVFWTSRPSADGMRSRSLIETLEDVLVVYEALKYSVKKKLQEKIYVLQGKINAKKLCKTKIKLYVKKLTSLEVQLQEFKQRMKWCFDVLEDVVQNLEDALLQKMENAVQRRRSRRGKQFPDSALDLLRRMEDLKRVLSASSGIDGPSMRPSVLNHEERAELAQELSEAATVVVLLMEAYAETEALIVHNREVKAEMNDMLLELEKER